MKRIIYLVLFTVSLSVSGQTLQMYKGEFPLPIYYGQGFERSTGNLIGYAEYEYKDAPDGTRIYEGAFNYTHNKGLDKVVRGNFLNNKQVGEWIWNLKDKWGTYYGETVDFVYIKIKFDNYGVVDGNFSIFSQVDAQTHHEFLRYFGLTKISGIFTKGIITKLSYYCRTDDITAKGNYSSINLGAPVGKWTISGKDVPDGEVILEFDDEGYLVKKPVYYDKSTGDKYYVRDWICAYPKKIYNEVIEKIRKHCYRDTERPKFSKK